MAEYSTQAGERVAQSEQVSFGIGTFVNIVPRNPVEAAAEGDMLGLIFFALVALQRIARWSRRADVRGTAR